MAVLFDIQGTQSPTDGERGIGRYLTELSSALVTLPSEHVTTYVLDASLPVPTRLENLKRRARLEFQDRLRPVGDEIYHLGSPLDCQLPLDRILPLAVQRRRLRFTATLYDLIPLLYPDDYLGHKRNFARYTVRLELLRQAERVLAISRSAADDAVDKLGFDPDRITVVGTGVSERFKPPRSRQAAAAHARDSLSGLDDRFILVACAGDPRKNVERMVDAYASLPPELRASHQLVIVGRLGFRDRAQLQRRAAALGAHEPILFPGYVSDELLVQLYQGCTVFVFPSLYEGFGLPAAEARACGAPTLVADSSALVEIVPEPGARFDPTNVREIRDALHAVLSDPERLELIRPKMDGASWSWTAVAERTEMVFDQLSQRRVRPRNRRATVALVSPLPPQRSGVADYSARLLEELSRRCDVDAFVTPSPQAERTTYGPRVFDAESLELAERISSGYTNVVYCIGNSEHHLTTLTLLRRRPGVVIAHDVRLTGLYQAASWSGEPYESRRFGEIVRAMYGPHRFQNVDEDGAWTLEEFDRAGLFMTREVIERSERFLVHSEHAAQIARNEASPDMAWKVAVLPFAAPPPRKDRRNDPQRPIVATFGHAHPSKQHAKIVEAFRSVLDVHPSAILGIVGPIYPELELELREQIARLGLDANVVITGGVDDRRYQRWLDIASVAVQLRAVSNGESSATVNDCLAAGIPTLVTAIGSGIELPDHTVVKVEKDISPLELGATISTLLLDDPLRQRLGDAGLDYARDHSYAKVAERLLEILDAPFMASLAA
jgi:glycosyltransferase involved in cell wall biosynthesis